MPDPKPPDLPTAATDTTWQHWHLNKPSAEHPFCAWANSSHQKQPGMERATTGPTLPRVVVVEITRKIIYDSAAPK